MSDNSKHWYVAQNFLTGVLSVEYSEDGSYSKTKPPFSEDCWFNTELEAEDYMNKQKELEEKCNNITEENINIEEWDIDKDITYIINAINNSCYIPKIKFELIEAVIAIARRYKLE